MTEKRTIEFEKMDADPIRERCQVCHQISYVGFWVPNDVWRKAIPHTLRASILCIACFASRADEKLVRWDTVISFEPTSLVNQLEFVEKLKANA